MEVTALPPTFNWKLQIILGTLLLYEYENKIGNWLGTPTL
jgi:hypothetical protein